MAAITIRLDATRALPLSPPSWNVPNQAGLWLGNASAACKACRGNGGSPTYRGAQLSMCDCVARQIFRACLAKYRDLEHFSRETMVGWTGLQKQARSRAEACRYVRIAEDYRADFYLISKRYLNQREWALFQMYMLEGRTWRECAAQVQMDRGSLFHSIYRMERTLGRIFLTLKPYGLFPLDEYFNCVIGRKA